MYHRVQAASPTQFHHLLKAIAEEGRLHRLYTQNVDGLDTQLYTIEDLNSSAVEGAMAENDSATRRLNDCQVPKKS